MKLTKDHREALVIELNSTIELLEGKRNMIVNAGNSKKEHLKDLKHYFELDEFLLQEKKKTIEKALIENEIDY